MVCASATVYVEDDGCILQLHAHDPLPLPLPSARNKSLLSLSPASALRIIYIRMCMCTNASARTHAHWKSAFMYEAHMRVPFLHNGCHQHQAAAHIMRTSSSSSTCAIFPTLPPLPFSSPRRVSALARALNVKPKIVHFNRTCAHQTATIAVRGERVQLFWGNSSRSPPKNTDRLEYPRTKHAQNIQIVLIVF